MVTLYDYQQKLLEDSQKALAPEGARVMTQLPTGGGKTEIAGALLKDFLVDGRKAVRRLVAKWCAEPSVHGGKRRPRGAELVV